MSAENKLFCEGKGVRFECQANDEIVGLKFHDVSYAKSEKIILDKDSGALHAVLHESSFYLGRVEGDIVSYFLNKQDITLSGTNGIGKEVTLQAKLSVVEH